MARAKRPPSESELKRSPLKAFARRSRTQGDDEPEDDSDAGAKPAADATKADATKADATKADATKADATKTAEKSVKPTASPDGETLDTGPMLAVTSETAAPALPTAATSAPAPVPVAAAPAPAPVVVDDAATAESAAAAARRAIEEMMPDPRAVPAGDPDDPAQPPGEVPRGDSRSLRRANEFVLVYRKRNVVVTRFGVVGRRGQWRVVEYPTPGYAANAYAREVSRWVGDGYSDFRES